MRISRPRFSRAAWFEISDSTGKLQGYQTFSGGLRISSSFLGEEVVTEISRENVEKLITWLVRTYIGREEAGNVIQFKRLARTLPVSGTSSDTDRGSRPPRK